MRSRPDRRSQLRRLYGFDFPDDLFEFWDFANRVRPLEPLAALAEELHIHLVGPFEVLAGRFDGRTPRLPLTLHWRYYNDPPEFFTALAGGTDALHWGYYLDDPAAGGSCVASYYASDAFEIEADGDSLFEAVRLDLERHYRDCEEYRLDDPDSAFEYDQRMQQLDRLRDRLPRASVADRPETGAAYEEAYPPRSARTAHVVAATREGMGIVVPAESYRPLSLTDRALWRALRTAKDSAALVAEGLAAARAGYPGTALKLGKDLWAIGGKGRGKLAYELLDVGYAGLGRDVLREVLRVHHADRDLPSVDILENESGEGEG